MNLRILLMRKKSKESGEKRFPAEAAAGRKRRIFVDVGSHGKNTPLENSNLSLRFPPSSVFFLFPFLF